MDCDAAPFALEGDADWEMSEKPDAAERMERDSKRFPELLVPSTGYSNCR